MTRISGTQVTNHVMLSEQILQCLIHANDSTATNIYIYTHYLCQRDNHNDQSYLKCELNTCGCPNRYIMLGCDM